MILSLFGSLSARMCSSKRLTFAAVLLGGVVPPSLCAQSTAGMVPFTMDHRHAMERPTPVDVSFLLDAPAGKHGFVQVKDGRLATADGPRGSFKSRN